MSDFDKFWKEEACGITFDYPHEGGEFAWNHQQQKIDAIKSKLHDIYDACDEDETVAEILDSIQELLK